jgi:hypothetical protein
MAKVARAAPIRPTGGKGRAPGRAIPTLDIGAMERGGPVTRHPAP